MGVLHIIYRVLGTRELPCRIRFRGTCQRCDCQVELVLPLRPMRDKPAALWCNVCQGQELKILSATAIDHYT